MQESYLHPADEICQVMSRVYENGMTTVSGGNLSVRDLNGDIWMSPSGTDKAALNRTDVAQIHADGTVIGSSKVSLETPIHLEILKVRKDFKAVFHAHPPALVTLSLLRELPITALMPHLPGLCGKVGIAPYAKPGSEELVRNVSEIFATGCNTVILENHGVFIGSTQSLSHAFLIFESLDMTVRAQLLAPAISKLPLKLLSDSQLNRYLDFQSQDTPEMQINERTGEELLLRRSVAAFTRRAYHNQLFCSTQGVFSAAFGEDAFVITPEAHDRAEIQASDLVSVIEGRREAGKNPDPMYRLHRTIYRKNKNIRSIVCFSSPNAMAYALTGERYDVSLIPECFLRLRGTKNFSFDEYLESPELIADSVSLETPVAFIENLYVLIAGVDPFTAYDRMEICENTAKSVQYTKSYGREIVMLNEDQQQDLRNRFRLAVPKPIGLDLQ